MSDDQSEFLEALLQQRSEVVTTVRARSNREMSGVHPLDRRGILTPPEHVRNVQLNIKVSRRWKSRVERLAVARKLSVTELLVRAFDAYAAMDKG